MGIYVHILSSRMIKLEVPRFRIYVEMLNKTFDVEEINYLYKYVTVFDDDFVGQRRINFSNISSFKKIRKRSRKYENSNM